MWFTVRSHAAGIFYSNVSIIHKKHCSVQTTHCLWTNETYSLQAMENLRLHAQSQKLVIITEGDWGHELLDKLSKKMCISHAEVDILAMFAIILNWLSIIFSCFLTDFSLAGIAVVCAVLACS